MKPKEIIEFLKAKIRQLVTRKKMEELRDRAKQFASKENIGNMAAKAKELASKDNLERMALKSKALVSGENVEKVGQGLKGLKTVQGRKNAVDKFRNMPTKQKVIGICLAGLLVFFLLQIVSCVGRVVFGVGDAECKKVADDENLILTTLPTFEVEKGVGYPYFGIGFKALQWLPDEKSVIAVLDWNGGMGFSGAAIQAVAMAAGGELGFLGGGLVLDEMKKNAQPIWLRTHKSYTDGASIDEQGIFVYDGIVTYKTKNGSRTVRSFTEVDPKFAKKYFDEQERKGKEREAKQKEAEEKAFLDEYICDGYTVKLPDTLHVKSICGVDIGVPTKAIERNLGKRIEKPTGGIGGATYLLKKPFRVFDKVQIHTTMGGAPYKLVTGGTFTGRIDVSRYSKDACEAECSAIISLMSDKFKLKFNRKEANLGGDRLFIVEAECPDNHADAEVRLSCDYRRATDKESACYEFTLDVSARYVVEDEIKILRSRDAEKAEAEKKQKVFSDKAGADVL